MFFEGLHLQTPLTKSTIEPLLISNGFRFVLITIAFLRFNLTILRILFSSLTHQAK
jgi:hypothetical protein